MMARQAVRVPCPFVDIFEGVSTQLLRFFGLGLLLLDLAEEGSHRLEQLRDPSPVTAEIGNTVYPRFCNSVVSDSRFRCASGISVLLSATSIGLASRSSS